MIAALSLATGLGMGQPMEQALRTCLLSVRLGERLGLGPPQLSDVYYVALLRFLGCTADAHETAAIVGGDDLAFRAAIAPVLGGSAAEFLRQAISQVGRDQGGLHRMGTVGSFLVRGGQIRQGVRAHCELAENLSQRLGLSAGVRLGLAHALERWDGTGIPGGVAGESIALPARIAFLARDVEVLCRLCAADEVLAIVRRRQGAAYDPHLVAALARHGPDLLAEAAADSPWQAVLAAEPEPPLWVPPARLDGLLEAFADFVDLKSPFTLGHSRGVATLAASAAQRLRLEASEASAVRRAGLLHDLGRVGVPNGIWEKRGPLTEGEWERIRLHAYYTERILARPQPLAPLAMLAGMHHERLDGGGYHRACRAAAIPTAARVLAAADAYQAMTEPRAHRPALAPAAAAQHLVDAAAAGRQDREVVDAVLEVAGQRRPPAPRTWPAGLTDREVEVLRLLCRGSSKRQVADDLRISPRTADHHVRHIYDKLGVSTRAGAAVFALQDGLFVAERDSE